MTKHISWTRKGTIFRFHLPYSLRQQSIVRAGKTKRRSFQRKHIASLITHLNIATLVHPLCFAKKVLKKAVYTLCNLSQRGSASEALPGWVNIANSPIFAAKRKPVENLSNQFDSIIFDLDGTLWDSSRNVAEAWQIAIDKVDYVTEVMTVEKVRSITGLAYNVIFDKLFPYLDLKQRTALMAICAEVELDVLYKQGGDLYPNLKETLKYLSTRYRLYIVSNCQSGYIEVFLKLNDMAPYFLGHQCYGTKGQPKAQNIADIVSDHHLKAPVYVGDTIGDYNAATTAGVPFIFASYGFGKVENGQIATINSFDALTQIL